MKLINLEMKGHKFNIDGKNIIVDEKGVIELDNKEAAKSLCSHAGFKLIRSGKALDVEPVLTPASNPKAPPAAHVSEPIQGMDELSDEELADIEAEEELNKLPESDKTQEDIDAEALAKASAPAPQEPAKPEAKAKWLPGKNNKQNK